MHTHTGDVLSLSQGSARKQFSVLQDTANLITQDDLGNYTGLLPLFHLSTQHFRPHTRGDNSLADQQDKDRRGILAAVRGDRG